jgi:hypothetical protein
VFIKLCLETFDIEKEALPRRLLFWGQIGAGGALFSLDLASIHLSPA